MKTVILSLGGSIIVPDEVDYFFLKDFKSFVINYIKKDYRFIIFCGGGQTNRKYNRAARRVSYVKDKDLDWIGIMSSRLNAELIRVIFGDLAYKKVLYNPNKKVTTKKQVIVAHGLKPEYSKDYYSVHIKKKMNIKEILNLTNISYVYDKDPSENPDAKKIKEISWKDYRKLIDKDWSPRLSTPFDPIASKEAQQQKNKVVILKGTDLKNLEKYFEDREFEGTVIQ